MREKSERSFRTLELVGIRDKLVHGSWIVGWDKGISTWMQRNKIQWEKERRNYQKIQRTSLTVFHRLALINWQHILRILLRL